MPVSIRAHLATQPDSALLESLAILANRAVALENDVETVKHGVAKMKVSESSKIVGLLEDLSRRLKKLETATAKKKNYRHRQNNENSNSRKLILPDALATPFVPSNSNSDRTNVLPNNAQSSRPHVRRRQSSKTPSVNMQGRF